MGLICIGEIRKEGVGDHTQYMYMSIAILTKHHCVFLFRMPSYCFVPGCKSEIGGHKFPLIEKWYDQWVTAIKRQEPGKSDKLMVPKSSSVVCQKHFLPSDYRETLTGTYTISYNTNT